MKKRVIALMIVMLVISCATTIKATNEIDRSWSKIKKVAFVKDDPYPLSILNIEDKVIGTYLSPTNKEIKFFFVDNKNKIHKEFASISYQAKYAMEPKLFPTKEGFGLAWREKDDNQQRLMIASFDLKGNLLTRVTARDVKTNLKGLNVSTYNSGVYLIWLEKEDEKQHIFTQKWNFPLENESAGQIFDIRSKRNLYNPNLIGVKNNKLFAAWKERGRPNTIGMTRRSRRTHLWKYTYLDESGEKSRVRTLGTSREELKNDSGDTRNYDTIDPGVALLYDKERDRLVSVWAGKDGRMSITRKVYGTSPKMTVIEDGKKIHNDDFIISLKTMSHFPDIAFNRKGKVDIVWSDDVTGTFQTVFGSVEQAKQFRYDYFRINSYEKRDEAAYDLTSTGQRILDKNLPVTSLSESTFGAWYPELIIDNSGVKHLFWWETVEGGHKLVYRNNVDPVPYKVLSRIGLQPEADNFNTSSAFLHIMFIILLALLVGSIITFVNMTNYLITMGFFGILNKLGWKKNFKEKPFIVTIGIVILLWFLQNPNNPIYYAISPEISFYFWGGICATIGLFIYQYFRKPDMTRFFGMLESILFWSFCQHVILVLPKAISWLAS